MIDGTLLALGIIPFVLPFLYGIYVSIFGFTFLYDTSYGFEAMYYGIVSWSLLFWPTYILGILFLVLAKIKKKKDMKD